jgi:hypothetical protein
MAEVVGGKNNSLPGRVTEIVAWFPALAALIAAGGASMMQTNHLMPSGAPGWLPSVLNMYQDWRDQLIRIAIGKSVQANYADMAVGGIALVTMLSRKVLGFTFSIAGFVLLAAVAWFVLRSLSH